MSRHHGVGMELLLQLQLGGEGRMEFRPSEHVGPLLLSGVASWGAQPSAPALPLENGPHLCGWRACPGLCRCSGRVALLELVFLWTGVIFSTVGVLAFIQGLSPVLGPQ